MGLGICKIMGSALAALEFCLNQTADEFQPIKRTRAVVVAMLCVEGEEGWRAGKVRSNWRENQKNRRAGRIVSGTFAQANFWEEGLVGRSDWTAAARCDEFPQVQLNGGGYWSWEDRVQYTEYYGRRLSMLLQS